MLVLVLVLVLVDPQTRGDWGGGVWCGITELVWSCRVVFVLVGFGGCGLVWEFVLAYPVVPSLFLRLDSSYEQEQEQVVK
jgi:hypothetical protein